MKTAEELGHEMARHCDDSFCFDQNAAEETICRIQLDAMKEGMRRAAEICKPSRDTQYRVWLHEIQRENNESILTAAEQLTIKDL